MLINPKANFAWKIDGQNLTSKGTQCKHFPEGGWWHLNICKMKYKEFLKIREEVEEKMMTSNPGVNLLMR